MSYLTVEVEIEHGRIVACEPGMLPEKAIGLLTILPAVGHQAGEQRATRRRAALPLICGDGKHIINPTSEDLDVSLWGD